MLIQELAEKIVSEVRKLLNEDIIVVDTQGMIMASTDPDRVHTFHEGAFIASQKKDKLIISEEDQTILRGVKAGINLPIFFQRDVVGVIGITGDPETVSPYGEIIRKMTELLISESYFTEQFDWQSRSIEAFLLDWIQFKEWDESFTDRAKLLDIDLTVNRRIMIAEFNQDSTLLHRDGWLSILAWNERNQHDIIARWGNNRVIYLSASKQQKRSDIRSKAFRFQKFLSERLQTVVSIGIGSRVSPSQIQQSYHQAERALKSRKKDGELVFDEDLTLEMVLDDIKQHTKKEFVLRTIEPLIKEQELITTLQKLLQNDFNLKKTAQSLHIHINTLHYRLKKILELTNLNPRKTDDLFILYLALLFLDDYTKK